MNSRMIASLALLAMGTATPLAYADIASTIMHTEGLLVIRPTNTGLVTEPGASVVTPDALTVVVQDQGGGFSPPPPPGSGCAVGAATFTLDLKSGDLSWTQCEASTQGPLENVTGDRVLSADELASVLTTLSDAKVAESSTICGADKPFENIAVTTPAGTFTYEDSFYSCMSPDQPHVDGLDTILSTLTNLAH